MRHLELTEIALADLKSIRPYSQRTWGPERTAQYMSALRDTLKELLAGTVVSRTRDDLGPGLQMATSGRHRVFFEADSSRILTSACSTTAWTIGATSKLTKPTNKIGEPSSSRG